MGSWKLINTIPVNGNWWEVIKIDNDDLHSQPIIAWGMYENSRNELMLCPLSPKFDSIPSNKSCIGYYKNDIPPFIGKMEVERFVEIEINTVIPDHWWKS